jgi:tetratricopeptide (TPR) repeat protein
MFAYYRALAAAPLILCTSVLWAATAPGKDARKAYQDGLKYEAAQQPERAIQAYSEAVQAAPDYVEAYEHRAKLRLARGLAVPAADDYTVLIRLKPDNAELYRLRGDAVRAAGLFAKAIPITIKRRPCT